MPMGGGVIIVTLAIGHEFSQFAGWMILGGMLFAGLWNAFLGMVLSFLVLSSKETDSDEE